MKYITSQKQKTYPFKCSGKNSTGQPSFGCKRSVLPLKVDQIMLFGLIAKAEHSVGN